VFAFALVLNVRFTCISLAKMAQLMVTLLTLDMMIDTVEFTG